MWKYSGKLDYIKGVLENHVKSVNEWLKNYSNYSNVYTYVYIMYIIVVIII